MADKRPLLVLLALLAVIIGGTVVFGSPGGSGDNETLPDEIAAPTTITSAPPTSLTEAGWRAALDRVTALENEVFVSPNPRRVSEFMTTGCSCYISTVNTLTEMASKGYRKKEGNLNIAEAHLIGQPSPNEVRLFVTVKGGGKPTVDANGKVIQAGATGEFPPVIYTLVKGNDGAWRIAGRDAPEERS